MKRTLFLITLTFFFFTEINAQFSIGVSAGINLSNVKYDVNIGGYEDIETNCMQYYFFGVIPRYNFNSRLSVSSDIQYSLKGYKFKDGILFSGTKYQFIYLDVIPKVEYHILKWLAIGAGFNVGFTIDEKQKYSGQDWFSTKDIETIASTDFGLVGSIRGSFKNFFISVSYNHGLKDINNVIFTDDNGQPLDGNLYNRNFQINLGYFFAFKKSEEKN